VPVVAELPTKKEQPVTPPIAPVVEAPLIKPEERRTLDLPLRPPVKRKWQKELRFPDIYETRSFSIDKRITKEFDDYMGLGETKTSFANQLFLKILIDVGYNLEPDLLTKPPK
jgi:hypothetical protein